MKMNKTYSTRTNSLGGALFGSPRQTTNESEFAILLGWAAQRNIPFHEALKTLPHVGLKSPFLRNIYGVGSWTGQLGLAIRDLEKGATLSSAISAHLSKYISPYYVAAVRRAERDGRLAQILPHLASVGRYSVCVKQYLKSSLLYPSIQIPMTIMFISTLYIFIFPKFIKIFDELFLEGIPPPLLMRILSYSVGNLLVHGRQIATFLLWIVFAPIMIRFNGIWGFSFSNSDWGLLFAIVLQIVFLIIIPYLYFKILLKILNMIFAPMTDIFHRILFHLPLFGGQMRNFVLLELSSSMAALVKAGHDVGEAARWNAEIFPRKWLRRKIAKFADAVEKGEYWPDAWEAMGLCTSSQNWIIRNAASRENPTQGFEILSEWLDSQINRTNRVILIVTENFGILLSAVFVGSIVFALWQTLCAITCHANEW
jgi:type II secretory pathway component PulF